MTVPAPLLVVGDALLDRDVCGRVERLAPDAPVPVVSGPRRATRPGGAALAACLAAADGRPVTLVTALGDDPDSATLRELLADRLELVELPLTGALSSKTRVLADGRPLLRLDDGEGRAREGTREAARVIAEAGAVLVADYGRGTADVLREALAGAAARVPVVWDPHPRGRPPVPGVRLATPCAAEAHAFAGPADDTEEAGHGSELHTAAQDAGRLVRAWRAASVAVTLGGRGALLSHGATPLLVPSPVTADGDACGAGDRFAATAAGLLADGELVETAVRGAVHAATRYVAEGGVRTLAMDPAPTEPAGPPSEGEPTDDALRTAARVRAAGGTVVAAGGCFDLLHAGHVALLQAARRTGDCLVVCVNSDASVRRRKGDGRPLVPEADRIRVLRALECVDAVAVFDEDTPERLLAELRPHIWAKGGDYAMASLPEAPLVESWGGQVVLFPYLDGRSTTGIAERAALAPRTRTPGTRPAAGSGRRSR
ncbi:D-glycero-beta-D-manno-heptose 1-phosphate adenylyltransferase [Streptomyces sp. ISL-22]|uniref:D-glycero-beta-D-manno-heptose 1-phosphate adenylyltransferase n=2 Tax=unclassified Streptomyces TaxID=2593676 RepID=UPI001BE7CD15|nr:D-glycero-beta-D-manno-heptose 1-phosphate adenylyltransferase [Streptomyces sp. ISL-22]MBT2436609.1 D-glycero-beta-D-manno-heptose 1-phosphate adenylyltransferase [Streptomyces sp. ISL-22]